MPSQELRNSLKNNHRLHWYLIDRVLGQGGFGITYLAHDPNLDRYVAVKEYLPMELAVRDGDNSVYPASEANGERYKWGLDRFIAEARTLAKFKHPAIVRVLSVFEENNTAYMVMEYERGESFQQVLDQRKDLSEQELLRIIGPLLDGLELIHANGFIHRDIKPANIYIRRDGSPVLLDFGSARQALGEQTKSLTSIVSPGYAPFEQYYSKSDRQGPWTDIYSLA
ncbi:MAG: serine/threonine protein kinase, partial [Gammaproteobacteria bacterium]